MPSFSPELGLLRHVARACLDDPTDTTAPTELPVFPDWTHVLWLGRQHGLLLLLREALLQGFLCADCPAYIRAQLDDLHAAAKLQALDRTAEICRLHDLLEQAGIPWALIDPWMFQACFHPHRTLSETVTEIRCLLLPEDLPRARKIMAAAGHMPSSGSFQVAARHQTPIDLVLPPSSIADAEALLRATSDDTPCIMAGGRMLRLLRPCDWLRLLASPNFNHPELSLAEAWRTTLLASLAPADLARADPSLHAMVAIARNTLGASPPPSLTGKIVGPPLTTASGASPPPRPELPVAPFVPTPAHVSERMLMLAEIQPDDVVLDLGCGEGQIVISAALHYGAHAIGIDCDPALLATARTRAETAGVSERVTWNCADLFSADISTATVISLYLLPAFYPRIHELLLRSARPGTRIVSHDYLFSGWPPEKTELVRASPTRVSQIYLWRIP